MNKPGEPGSRSVSWITADRGAGVGLVMRGSIELNTGVGTGADGDGGTGAPG